MGTLADWADPQSVMTICTPQAGSVLPSDLVMTAGNAGTGAACTATFSYTVNAGNPFEVGSYTTRK